uniref:Uncharacterized protein n=1 Tax=Plectus sambesii TaxID=2011161 RepID=A0A914X0V3_9BILA
MKNGQRPWPFTDHKGLRRLRGRQQPTRSDGQQHSSAIKCAGPTDRETIPPTGRFQPILSPLAPAPVELKVVSVMDRRAADRRHSRRSLSEAQPINFASSVKSAPTIGDIHRARHGVRRADQLEPAARCSFLPPSSLAYLLPTDDDARPPAPIVHRPPHHHFASFATHPSVSGLVVPIPDRYRTGLIELEPGVWMRRATAKKSLPDRRQAPSHFFSTLSPAVSHAQANRGLLIRMAHYTRRNEKKRSAKTPTGSRPSWGHD